MENMIDKDIILGGETPLPIKEVNMDCKCKFDVNKQLGNADVQFYSSEDTTELYKALSEFHKHFTTVEKDAENPFHESSYASLSATWNDEQDCYDTCSEEGDDYYKGVSGIPGADEYYKQFAKPNMPTHWMKMPTHP